MELADDKAAARTQTVLILGRCRFQVFQLKFHLLQQPSLALRAAAVKLPRARA